MEKTYQRLIRSGNKWLKGLTGGIFLLSALLACNTQAGEIKLISDEETEQFLAQIIQPLFKAAGISFYRNNIFIVEDNSLNAFVTDGNSLFVHTGTIIRSDNSNELAGVLAHETGHIMGGHILRQKLKNQDMQEVSLISAVLAGTTAVLGGRSDVAMAVLLGGQSSALTHYTRYRTGEERSADESAVKLLAQTHQSPQGILRFMKKIKQDNILNGRDESPYFRTHPITNERIAFFDKASEASPYKQTTDDAKFERIKAKLKAYLLQPKQIYREYPSERTDIPAQYAQTIALLKELKFDLALQKIDKLLAQEPNNPFFYELKGQILTEIGRITQAKQCFAKALQLLPDSHLMQINYAHVILQDNPNKSDALQAASLLNKALVRSQNASIWMLLSQAYGIADDMAAANYAAAEYSLKIGNIETAINQVKTARKYKSSNQLKLKIDDLEQRLTTLEKELKSGRR